ncbi:phosphatase PAP2 family protein [Kribbella sp. NPDC049174]|uniref:phosphatase PAP2 family protein n=1 Tax=Kribbella sp. NPDC049174 TaxID=3364112 RepID=UPI00371E7A2F
MTTRYDGVRRALGSIGVLIAGAVVVLLLYPGGLGTTVPVRVTSGESASVFRAVNEAVADAPSWVGSVVDVAGDGLLLVLGLLLVWTALRCRDARTLAGVLLTGVGTAAAYGMSEALKLVVDEERPCRAVSGAELIAHCPAIGDWSFPSNHATLAAGLAVGIALLRPRLATVALPLAAAVVLARVAAGVHYPHDVVAGAALGASLVAAILLIANPLAAKAVGLLTRGRRIDADLLLRSTV